MNNIAQIYLTDTNAISCLQYADQLIVLSSAWVVMLIVCIVLSAMFFFLKQTKFSAVFVTLLTGLVLAKALMSSDECHHGGLFSESGLGILGIFAIVILICSIWGFINYWKRRSHR